MFRLISFQLELWDTQGWSLNSPQAYQNSEVFQLCCSCRHDVIKGKDLLGIKRMSWIFTAGIIKTQKRETSAEKSHRVLIECADGKRKKTVAQGQRELEYVQILNQWWNESLLIFRSGQKFSVSLISLDFTIAVNFYSLLLKKSANSFRHLYANAKKNVDYAMATQWRGHVSERLNFNALLLLW